jgi:hypothetical protein
MPKKSFNSIQASTILKFSKAFGTGEKMPIGLGDQLYFESMNAHTSAILGYTGYKRVHKYNEGPAHDRKLSRFVPGYSGFLPGEYSESVIGKRHGVIASACTSRSRR